MMSEIPEAYKQLLTDEYREKFEKANPDKSSYTITYGDTTKNYSAKDMQMLSKAYAKKLTNDTAFAQEAYKSYTDSDFDKFAYEHKLPSWSKWGAVEKYAASYNANGDFAGNYGNVTDDQWSKIKELWAKDWQYGLTDADASRKAAGLAPVSYDSMYEDTLLDDELKERGLPPSKLLAGKLGEKYNSWVKDDEDYTKLMADVSREWKRLDDMNSDLEKVQSGANQAYAAMGKEAPKLRAYTFEDAFNSVLSRPEWTEYANKHFGRNTAEPKRYDKKYRVKDDDGYELQDSNGQYVYDYDAYEKDYDSWLSKRSKIDSDEFAITLDKAQDFYAKNYAAVKAADDAEASIKAAGITDLNKATPDQISTAEDLFAGKQAEPFTVDQLFGDLNLTQDEKESFQPQVDKLNNIMQTQGLQAAYTYMSGGEFRKDMMVAAEQDIVSDYRQQFPESEKTDDQIKEDYYNGIATSYGLDADQLAAYKDGALLLSDVMSDKVKTDGDAAKFAEERLTRELAAKGLPTTKEGLEEAKELPDWYWRTYDIVSAAGNKFIPFGWFDKISPNTIMSKIDPKYEEWFKQAQAPNRAAWAYDATVQQYYYDALQYTDKYKKIASDQDNVNKKFSDLVSAAFGDSSTDKLGEKRSKLVTDNATDEEKATAVYVASTSGYQEVKRDEQGNPIFVNHNGNADDYIKSLAVKYSNKEVESRRGRIAEWYNSKNGFVRAMSAYAAAYANINLNPFESTYNFVKDTVSFVGGDDFYANERAGISTDMFSAVASEIDKKHGEFASTAYQMVPSFVQSAEGAALAYITGGASEAFTLAAMGMQAYSSTCEEALLNGATTEQAYTLGVAAGAAEVLFEKMSLDHFVSEVGGITSAFENGVLDFKTALKLTWSMLKRQGTQGGIELSEEAFTSIANTMAEQIILGYDSNFEKRKQHFIEAGYTAEEAGRLAGTEIVDSIKKDAILGFVSGALMTFGTDIISTGTNVTLDKTGAIRFMQSSHNLSAISTEEAMEIANKVAQVDSDGNLTLEGAKAVVQALKARGVGSAVLSEVRNQLTDAENTTNDVMDVFAKAGIELWTNEAITLATAAKRVLARSYKNASKGWKASASKRMNAAAQNYLNSYSAVLQEADRSALSDAIQMVQSGYVDIMNLESGRSYTAGDHALDEYMKTIPADALQAVSEPFMQQLRSAGMDIDLASRYASKAGALVYMTQDEKFSSAFSAVFGKHAGSVSQNIATACLNSSSKRSIAFIDNALNAIGFYTSSDSSGLAKTLGQDMNDVAYVTSLLALAESRKDGSYSRMMYDYITKNGITRSLIDMLSAVVYYDNMSKSVRNAATKYVLERNNAFIEDAERQSLVDEHSSAAQEVENKQDLVESHKQHNAQTEATADSVVQRHQAANDAVRQTEIVQDANGNTFFTTSAELADVAASHAAALSDAINARNNLKEANEDRLSSAEADLKKAENKLKSTEKKYKTAMNRYCAAYVQLIGAQIAQMDGGNKVSISELDRIVALATYGTREDLNSVRQKIANAEKRQAICLANEIGMECDVVAFDTKFFDEMNVANRDESREAAVINGKLYFNDSVWQRRPGYGVDSIIRHEVAHIAEKNAKNWSAYCDMAKDFMTKKYGAEAVDNFIRDEGINELAAEFTRREVLEDVRAVKALCSNAPVLATRMFQWMNRITSAHKGNLAQLADLRKAQVMFAKELRTSIKESKSQADQDTIRKTDSAFDEYNTLENINQNEKNEQETAETVETEERTEEQTSDEATVENENKETLDTEETISENETTASEDSVDITLDQKYNIDEDVEAEQTTNGLPFALPQDAIDAINREVQNQERIAKNGKVEPWQNKSLMFGIKKAVNDAAQALGVEVDEATVNAFAEQYKLPEIGAAEQNEKSPEFSFKEKNAMRRASESADALYELGFLGDGIHKGMHNTGNTADYMTEFTPTEKQLHDVNWYLQPSTQEYWANHPKYKGWAHRNLAWISAAAHNQVNIPYDVLLNIPEVRAAQAESDAMTANRTRNSLSDHNDQARLEMRDKWVRWILGLEPISTEGKAPYTYGSAVYYTDAEGKQRVKYDGPVARDKQAYLILGRPAAGKSSVFADPYSSQYQARIIDSDLIKEWTPEFIAKGGVASGYVQNESAVLADQAINETTGYYEEMVDENGNVLRDEKGKIRYKLDENGERIWHDGTGENIVIPRVGGPSINEFVEKLKDRGYTVTVLYNDLPMEKSIMRAMSRFAEKDRYIDISYLHSIGQGRFDAKCWKAFETIYNNKNAEFFDWRDNDVGVNEQAIERWNSNDGRTLEQAKQDVEAEAGQNVVGNVVAADGVRTGSDGTAGVYSSSESTTGVSRETKAEYLTPFTAEQLQAIDDEYMPMARRYDAGVRDQEEMVAMRRILKRLANAKNPWRFGGSPQQLYSAQMIGVRDFTPKNPYKNQIFMTSNIDTADSYLHAGNEVKPFVVEMKDQYVLDDSTSNENLIDNARRLLNETYEDVSTHTEEERMRVMSGYKLALNSIISVIDSSKPSSFSDVYSEINDSVTEKYGERAIEIMDDIMMLVRAVTGYPAYINMHISDLFNYGSPHSQFEVTSQVEEYLDTCNELNKELTDLFAKDPSTFNKGKMKAYYDYVMEGGLEALADTIGMILGDSMEYEMTNVFENQETGEILNRAQLENRLRGRKRKAVYGVYAFKGDNPYEMDAYHSDWSDLSNEDYAGDTPRRIFNSAREEDGVTSFRVRNVDDWGYSSFNPDVHTTTFGDDVQVPSDEEYFLVKSSDLVTHDKYGDIVPPSQRFNLTKNDIAFYTEFNAIDSAISEMTPAERARYGNPRLVDGNSGLLLARDVSENGFASGLTTAAGKRNIALLTPASKFTDGKNAWLRQMSGLKDCEAVVIPAGKKYADLRNMARDAGVIVTTYDEGEPSQFNNAVQIAAASNHVQYNTSFDDYIKKYGQQKHGMQPYMEGRPVPKKTSADKRVSQMARTIAESPFTSEATYLDNIQNVVASGAVSYVPQTNLGALSKASSEIESLGGAVNALNKLTADVAAGTGKAAEQLAIAESLFMDNNAMESYTDLQREQLISNMCIVAHDAGTALQLTSALKRLSPQGHIFYIEQVGKRMGDQYEKRTGIPTKLTLTDDEKARYAKATPDQYKEIDAEVTARWGQITDRLSVADKIRNWRYLSMLGNARTHFRNMVGNALMYPVVRTKDSINALYQSAFGVAREDRTSTFVTRRLTDAERAYVDAAQKEAIPIMQGVSSKYIEAAQSAAAKGELNESTWKKIFEDVSSTHITEGRTLLGRGLNALASANSNLLELEDALALGLRFRSAFSQLIQARGYDVNNITSAQRQQMMDYAMKESLKATFRDANSVADAINKFQRDHKKLGLAVEAVMPFKKTPMNIVRRSVEYSPIGLLQGAYKMVSNKATYDRNVKAINAMDNVSESERQARLRKAEAAYKAERIAAIDRLAAGTTGGIMTALGVLAASLGWVTIGRKDDDSAAFETSLGRNAYSLNIGDVSVDLSAFSPAAVPMLMGVALYESMQKNGTDDSSTISSLIDALTETVDPITEMSMLSGLADAMKGVSYSNQSEGRNTRWFSQLAGNAAKSFVGQFIPTVAGQFARVADPYARSYSAGEEYFASKIAGPEVGSTVKNLQNKIPFAAWLSEPKVDVHGDKVRNYTNFGEWVLHAANNFVLPATIKVDRKNDIDEELVRLYGVTDGDSIFPAKPSRSIGQYTDKKTKHTTPLKLQNDAEYTQYQEEYGQMVYDSLEELMQSNAYKHMTDDQKADAVSDRIEKVKSQIRKLWKAKKIRELK